MITRTKNISHTLGLQKTQSTPQGLSIQAPSGVILPPAREASLIPHEPDPIIIHLPSIHSEPDNNTLSNFLRIGRMYHPLCRHAFVEKVQVGYYAYERREEFRTCALAAAYAGAFGPQSVERPDFSYSMAIWRLSQLIGFNIGERNIVGPTGRHNNLADEMIKLVDENLWTRAGVAEWVASLGY